MLGSYIINGILRNLEAKDVGNETYPPNPIVRSALSFFKILIDLNIEKKIITKDKILPNKFLLVGVPVINSCDLNFEFLFRKLFPLLSVTNSILKSLLAKCFAKLYPGNT